MNRNSDDLSQPPFPPDQEEQKSAHDQAAQRKPRASSRRNTASQEEEKVSSTAMKPTRKRKWKRPKDMPKRPLSAYNIFFHYERERLMHENDSEDTSTENQKSSAEGKSSRNLGFVKLSRTVAARWHALDADARVYYEKEAEKEQARYEQEIGEWKRAAMYANRPEKQDEQALAYAQDARFAPTEAAAYHQESVGTTESRPPTLSLQQLLWLGLPQSNIEPSNDPAPSHRPYEPPTYQLNIGLAASTQASRPPQPNIPNAPSSSLQQLMSELDEEEQEFLASLRDVA